MDLSLIMNGLAVVLRILVPYFFALVTLWICLYVLAKVGFLKVDPQELRPDKILRTKIW